MHTFCQQGWLRQSLFCEKKGLSTDALHKIRPKLREKYHIKKGADGCIWVHYERFDEWVERNDFSKPL